MATERLSASEKEKQSMQKELDRAKVILRVTGFTPICAEKLVQNFI